MKIMHIVGNRPQFIKLAVLYPELVRHHQPGIIVHTGQHFDPNMSRVFFGELQLPDPNYDLGINQLPRDLMIATMTTELDKVLGKEKPDLVIVYGDTNSTLAGAIAARKRKIMLAHIEAGIRTGDEKMPEETNRCIADRLADLNFCCTSSGVENLKAEGIFNDNEQSRAYLSGDLMLDAVRVFGPQSLAKQPDCLPSQGKGFILATIHRQENNEDPKNLRNIIDALNKLHQETPVIFPVHPKTRSMLDKNNIALEICSCEPLGYFDMLNVLQKASAVITDSGGLSRESFFFKKPTLVLMQKPFWPELFVHGNCLPSSALCDQILSQYHALSRSDKPFNVDIFGNGHAAENISSILLSNS